MEWKETGFILGVRPYGETSALLESWTRDHGRAMGLVRGGLSRRWKGILQPGNRIVLNWRGRFSEQLGVFIVEADHLYASELMNCPLALLALNVMNELVHIIPERDPHPRLFDSYEHLLNAMSKGYVWLADLVRFELKVLSELGFGIDLTSCVATGDVDNLVYVSPRSGRAVSRSAGLPYSDRLLPLPPFLLDDTLVTNDIPLLLQGFKLAGFFLDRHVYSFRKIAPSCMREILIKRLILL
ncbi:MAG: DNA repair protein RecO [Alphaproteobacteria bacterium]|nr:DNA repair protein RecO [Alphaproteobacteria bacterium]